MTNGFLTHAYLEVLPIRNMTKYKLILFKIPADLHASKATLRGPNCYNSLGVNVFCNHDCSAFFHFQGSSAICHYYFTPQNVILPPT